MTSNLTCEIRLGFKLILAPGYNEEDENGYGPFVKKWKLNADNNGHYDMTTAAWNNNVESVFQFYKEFFEKAEEISKLDLYNIEVST